MITSKLILQQYELKKNDNCSIVISIGIMRKKLTKIFLSQPTCLFYVSQVLDITRFGEKTDLEHDKK